MAREETSKQSFFFIFAYIMVVCKEMFKKYLTNLYKNVIINSFVNLGFTMGKTYI